MLSLWIKLYSNNNGLFPFFPLKQKHSLQIHIGKSSSLPFKRLWICSKFFLVYIHLALPLLTWKTRPMVGPTLHVVLLWSYLSCSSPVWSVECQCIFMFRGVFFPGLKALTQNTPENLQYCQHIENSAANIVSNWNSQQVILDTEKRAFAHIHTCIKAGIKSHNTLKT